MFSRHHACLASALGTAVVFMTMTGVARVEAQVKDEPAAPAPVEGSTSPAQDDSTDLWTEARASAEVRKMHEGVESMGQRTIDQIIRFSVDDRYISISTPLAGGDDMRRVEIPGLPGVSTITVLSMGGDAGPKFPQFKHWQVTPGMLILTDVLSSASGMVQIVHTMEGPLGMRQVVLMQSPVVEEQHSLRLRVKTTSDLLPNASAGDVDLSARDWTEFRTLYPRATSVYLRPVLRQIGAEQSLLHISLGEAWQVLARHWTEPLGVRDKVDPVLARLNPDDFRDRARAVKELDTLGLPGAMVLSKIDRRSLTPEQVTRVDDFLKRTLPLSPDVATALEKDVDYLTTLLYIEDPDLTRAVLVQLHDVTGHTPTLAPDSTGKARADAVDALWNSAPSTQPAP